MRKEDNNWLFTISIIVFLAWAVERLIAGDIASCVLLLILVEIKDLRRKGVTHEYDHKITKRIS